MLNYANEMTREDLSRSFGETYCRAHIDGNETAVRVLSFNSASDAVVVPIDTISGQAINISTANLDFSMPDLGMVRLGSETYYAARSATRQWRRGLREQGIILYKLRHTGAVVRQQGRMPNFSRFVRKVLLHQEQHDTVINNNFARVGKWLFFRNLPVGTVDGTVVTSTGINVDLPEGYSYAVS